jgi:hypothetical protein
MLISIEELIKSTGLTAIDVELTEAVEKDGMIEMKLKTKKIDNANFKQMCEVLNPIPEEYHVFTVSAKLIV